MTEKTVTVKKIIPQVIKESKEKKDYRKIVWQGVDEFTSERTGVEIGWISEWGIVFVGITKVLG